MTKITICILLLLNFCNSNRSHYFNNKRIKSYVFYDVKTGTRYEQHERVYLNDSVFYEYSFPSARPDSNFFSKRDTFKIVNGEWYYLLNNNYHVFFNKNDFYRRIPVIWKNRDDTRSVIIGDEPCISYIPRDTIRFQNSLVYVSNVQFDNCSAVVPQNEVNRIDYWFDPNVGVVCIKSELFERHLKILEYWD